jgi:hypothetical protein
MKEVLKTIILNKYFIVFLVAVIGACSIYFLGNDNPIEEISEEIIKQETGLDIDLSPNTPENAKEDLSFLTKDRRYK